MQTLGIAAVLVFRGRNDMMATPIPSPRKGTAETGLTCSICDSPVDLDGEGGIAGNFGICPVAFCVWCHASIVDMVTQSCSRCQEAQGDVEINA